MSNILDRRALLRGAAITATAASYSRILGANDKMSLGLIGAGERGQHDMSQFQLHKDVDVVAVCDVFADKIDQAKSKGAPMRKASRTIASFSRRRNSTCALIATPDHWHSRCAIDALNAGKDVYVREAAHAQDRRRSAGGEGGARQQPHLPGGHAAALRTSITCRPKRNTSTPTSWVRSRSREPGGMATATICARLRHRCRRSPRISTGLTSSAR